MPKLDDESDDDSVEISDVDLSDDDEEEVDDEESDAPSTIPSDTEGQKELDDADEGEDDDQLAPLEDDMYDEVDGDDDDDEEYYDDDDDDDDEGDMEDGDDTALLLVKEDKFFERLNHFMDVQRKIEERMQKIDSKGRLKEIEVVDHSGGIFEEDGSCKLMYQQQDAEGEPAQNLGEVFEAAYQIKQSLRDLLDSMVDKVKGLDYVDAKIVELKPRDRANEKAREEYLTRTPGPPETWIFDILRASVTCKTMKQMESVNKFLTKKAHIVQAKNRFVTPAYSGYRDLLYHVQLKWPYKENVSFVAEIQVHHKDVLNLEKLFGLPNHYNYFRPIFACPDRTVQETMRDLEVIHDAKKIDDSLMSKLMSSDNPDQLYMYAKLFYVKLENYDKALQLYSRVLTLQESSIGEIHPKTATTYQDVGLVQAQKGDYDQALRSLQKCLEIQEQVFGPYSPEVAITRSHLGHTIVERGDDGDELMEHRGALQQYRKALVIREKCLGEDHLDVAGSYQNIGESLSKLGDFQGALAAYRESLSILESLLGENHADVAIGHSLLGNVLYQQGDFQGAMEEFSIALAIREEVFGKTHQTTADSHTEIGKLLTEVQDYEEAESRHRKALRIRETVINKESPEAAESHYWIGYVLNQQGKFKAALKEHKIGYDIRAKIRTKRHPDTKASLRSIRANENQQQEP
jgi:tetratricopeptide (TPR) repeat protein